MTKLETAKERLRDMQLARTFGELCDAGISFRQAMMDAHQQEGRQWDSWQSDACRWALSDSIAAENAFRVHQREACFVLLTTCRENLGRLLGETDNSDNENDAQGEKWEAMKAKG